MAALLPTKLGIRGGFSWHSYPGNAQTSWNKSDLTSFLLNTSWLRHEIIGRTGQKTYLLRHVILKNDHFAKTGSGQT
jgi:hypothetical protein